MTHKSTWKGFERRIAKHIGGVRTPLSGGNSRHTRGDIIHPTLYVECKLSGNIPMVRKPWDREWSEAKQFAKEEGKIPLFVHVDKGSKNPMVLMNFKDFVEILDKAGMIPVDEVIK